jgi:DNA-binding protein HU-beta
MTLDNLVSKVTAAGLAAGLFLLWWPTHLPSTGMQWLVLRGLAWTLVFEILVLSFVPLERLAARGLKRRRGTRAETMRRRLASAPAPARAGGAVLLALAGVVLPGLMLLHSGRPPAAPVAHDTTKVVRKVVVRKVVRERTVVVRAAAPAPATTPTGAAQAPPKATAKAEPTAKAKADAKTTTTAKKTAPATTQTTPKTTTAPATTTPASDPSALPDPAQQAAAPVADSSATSTAGQTG